MKIAAADACALVSLSFGKGAIAVGMLGADADEAGLAVGLPSRSWHIESAESTGRDGIRVKL